MTAHIAATQSGRDVFAAAGWDPEQWDDLYDHLRCSRAPGAFILTSWLRNPDLTFQVSLTPAIVLDFLARHGKQTAQLLTAVDAGATERFTLAFHHPHWPHSDYATAVEAWQYATRIGLSETQATGWASTGYLHSRRDQPTSAGVPTLSVPDRTDLIKEWTDRFGPDAWLWVLAGFTIEEAIAMLDDGKSPTDNQLRVMAALNGHTLPAGI